MKYADRVVAARQKYLDIGSQFGAQRMADLVSIALNDPSVMGKNALGAERLGRVFERVKELEATFDRAFCQIGAGLLAGRARPQAARDIPG